MDWIDFSELEPGDILPPGWTFTPAHDVLSDVEIAKKKDILLFTMRSDAIPAKTIYCVRDHINLSGINPLRGKNRDALGVRFPDMSHPYRIPSFCGRIKDIIIRAGQHPEHPTDAVEAAPIVYQSIIANHQKKPAYALIYGNKIGAQDIVSLFQGESHA